ncbi:hypothetical protein EPO33_01835 [Patescibacteria group bacterium]|nr:MAG: hypothetical protein EPO33_01835 [Patescibacteria group bacterium]
MTMMKYYLGGINGAGKTTLLHAIKEAAPGFEIIKGSHAFMDYLGIPGDYDALRKLSHNDDADRKFQEMLTNITSRPGDVVFDGHYLNIVRGDVFPIAGSGIAGFDAILLLRISTDTVLRRIEADQHKRDRALFPDGATPEERRAILDDYIAKYEAEFNRCATGYGLKSKVLDAEKPTAEILKDFLAFDRELRK